MTQASCGGVQTALKPAQPAQPANTVSLPTAGQEAGPSTRVQDPQTAKAARQMDPPEASLLGASLREPLQTAMLLHLPAASLAHFRASCSAMKALVDTAPGTIWAAASRDILPPCLLPTSAATGIRCQQVLRVSTCLCVACTCGEQHTQNLSLPKKHAFDTAQGLHRCQGMSACAYSHWPGGTCRHSTVLHSAGPFERVPGSLSKANRLPEINMALFLQPQSSCAGRSQSAIIIKRETGWQSFGCNAVVALVEKTSALARKKRLRYKEPAIWSSISAAAPSAVLELLQVHAEATANLKAGRLKSSRVASCEDWFSSGVASWAPCLESNCSR